LVSLNSLFTPQGAAAALVVGDNLALPNGGFIAVGVPNVTSYTAVTPATLVVGSVALKSTTISVSNVLARLDVGSKIYFNNAEIATVVKAVEPSNANVTLNVISNLTVSVPTQVWLQPSAVNGYQFLLIDKGDFPAVVSNLSPGRILISSSSSAVFPAGFITVLSDPLQSDDPDTYKVLVKGEVTGAGLGLQTPVAVTLYEAATSGYVVGVSTSALLSNLDYPAAKHWRNQLFDRETNTLLDSYEILPEAYSVDRFRVNFLFVEPNGTIQALDSGISFNIPAVGASGTSAFVEGSSYVIPLVRASIAVGDLQPNGVPFPTGTTAAEVLSLIEAEILQDSLISSLIEPPILSQTLQPPTLSLSTLVKGAQANRIYVEVARKTTGENVATGLYANDLLFNSSNITAALANWSSLPETPTPTFNSIYFKGGNSGSRSANLDLYTTSSTLLVKIVALSDGVYGNQIRVDVRPTSSGQFILNVSDLDSASYQTKATSETLNLSTRDVDPNTGIFNATSNSALIRAYYIPLLNKSTLTEFELDQVPSRVKPAFGQYIPTLDFVTSTGVPSPYSPAHQGVSYLQNLFLSGGSDAALEPDADSTTVGAAAMVRAVQALESEDIAILFPAGIVIGDARYAAVVEECLGQVNRLSSLNTNRRLILQAPPNLNKNQASLYGSQLNNKDVSLIAGFCAFTGISSSNTQPTAPLYAATLSLTSPQLSPAFVGNGAPVNGVISVDTLNTPQYLDAITRAGVDALFFDIGLNQFKFLNGRTTSRNNKEQLVTIRRVALQMMVDLNINTLSLLSSQNDESLRALVASSFDSYLSSRVTSGWIQNFRPTICDVSNNPLSSQVQNRLNISISYTPYFPADIIVIDVIQQFSIGI
jgi:hypothetical protein